MFEEMSNRINQLEKLTPAERKLVNYFQVTQENIALQSIYSISKGAGVSTATVTRFIIHLGYADFNDFKKNIRHELMGRLESSWDRFQLSRSQLLEGEGDQWTRYYKLVANDIKAAHGNISSEKMTQAAELIAQARGTVYVMGQFNSYVVANLFWQHLTILRPRTVFLNNQTGNLIHQILDVGKKDVLFAVTYERFAHQTTLAVKEFAERGATVIVMTDSELSPVSKRASLQFVVPIGWPAVFGSRCSGLMVVEGLTMHIANLLEDSLAERITNAMRLAKNFESFSHERSQRKLLKNGIPWHHVKKGGKNRK